MALERIDYLGRTPFGPGARRPTGMLREGETAFGTFFSAKGWLMRMFGDLESVRNSEGEKNHPRMNRNTRMSLRRIRNW
jgi:hypothetical protein